MLVKDLMDPQPPVAQVPGTRREVLRLFVQHNVSGLCVVKYGTRELAGVVTRSDLFNKPGEEQLAMIMTRGPQVVAPGASASEAARLFYLRKIHGLPVVEGNALVGLVSPTELLRVTKARGATVDSFVTGVAVPVWEETPLPVVWRTMQITRNNALPVMDRSGRLVGIVADSDLYRQSDVEERIGRRDLGLDDADEDSVREVAPLVHGNAAGLPDRPVKEIMVRKVHVVFGKSPAEEAAAKMAKARVNQLPVIDADDRVVGMVTDLDLMRAWFP